MSSLTVRRLAVIWLLSSLEVFSTARRIEWGLASVFKGPPKEGGLVSHDEQQRWPNFMKKLMPSKGKASQGTCMEMSAKKLADARGGHAHSHGASVGAAIQSPSLPLIKVLLQLLLTGLNVMCWLVPMKIKRFRENKDLISLANAFSGGVFLSLAFGHMIPHSQHGFEHSKLPCNAPYFVTLAGYILIFFVEKIAFDTHSFIEEHHHHHHPPPADELLMVNGEGKEPVAPVAAAAPVQPTQASSGRSAVVLLSALAIHSVLETMALGLCDTPIQATLLACSIALHQPAESIALLVSFLKSNLTHAQIIRYLSIFSAVGPLGLLTGLAVNSLASEIWDSVFVALAAGTFIYVGCTEIVAEEFEENEGKWKKFGALLAGVIVVGAITVVTEGWEHS